MNEDTAKIVDEAQKDKIQVSLISNNRPGGNVPLIAQKTVKKLYLQKEKVIF